jgi:beta-phosphoglucomutase-like phosphatase (HAD superfamily)
MARASGGDLLIQMVDVMLLEIEGVVFDTRALRRASLREACALHGVSYPVEADLDIAAPVKSTVVAAMARAGATRDDVLADLIERDAERAFANRVSVGGVALQAGIRQFVDRAASEARLAVVTRARRADADAMLHLSGFDAAFSCVVTADDTLDAQPSAAGIRLALDRLAKLRRVSRASVIALEDGVDGIRAARAARVRCVAVGSVAPHVAIEADAFVESLGDQTPATLDALSLPGRERVQ